MSRAPEYLTPARHGPLPDDPLLVLAGPQIERWMELPPDVTTARTPALWRGAGLWLPLLVFAALELVAYGGVVPARLLPPPSEVLATLRSLWADGLALH